MRPECNERVLSPERAPVAPVSTSPIITLRVYRGTEKGSRDRSDGGSGYTRAEAAIRGEREKEATRLYSG
jgi:hypothetical protein